MPPGRHRHRQVNFYALCGISILFYTNSSCRLSDQSRKAYHHSDTINHIQLLAKKIKIINILPSAII